MVYSYMDKKSHRLRWLFSGLLTMFRSHFPRLCRHRVCGYPSCTKMASGRLASRNLAALIGLLNGTAIVWSTVLYSALPSALVTAAWLAFVPESVKVTTPVGTPKTGQEEVPVRQA